MMKRAMAEAICTIALGVCFMQNPYLVVVGGLIPSMLPLPPLVQCTAILAFRR